MGICKEKAKKSVRKPKKKQWECFSGSKSNCSRSFRFFKKLGSFDEGFGNGQ